MGFLYLPSPACRGHAGTFILGEGKGPEYPSLCILRGGYCDIGFINSLTASTDGDQHPGAFGVVIS